MGVGLKVYADRMSQPSRAVLIFCKINGIAFQEILIDVSKNQQHSPEYKAINPMCQVPTIVDGRFKLSDSHAILIYISCAFPGVASHWYPGDLSKRAKIRSVLDWHHSNLRYGAAVLMLNVLSMPLGSFTLSPQLAKEAEKILVRSLSKLESFWLKDGRFLVGSSQPSIADLSLVCEIMQLELLDEKDYERILSPYKKVLRWVEDTKRATAPHFDEVHGILFRLQKRLIERRATQSGKNELKAKL